MKQINIARLLHLGVLLTIMLFAMPGIAQYDPIGYWRFEQPDTLDDSGFGHHIDINQSFITTANTDPIAGDYLVINDLSSQPSVSGILDDSSGVDTEMTVEFWFRSPKTFYSGRVRWQNKFEAYFEDSRLFFIVRLTSGSLTMSLNFNGTGTSGGHEIYDGSWHHFVFQYNAKSGEQRIFIDGNSPQDQNYSVVHGPSAPIRNGGTLQFSQDGGGYRMLGHFDEFTVYDTIIPPTLVWQHYSQGLLGNAYTFNDTTTTLPNFPNPVQQGEVNLLEFGPGYPNVSDSVLGLLRGYPLPRYQPGQDFRRLVPWFADAESMVKGSTFSDRGPRMVKMLEELEENWNFYLYSGILGANYGYVRWLDVNGFSSHPNHWPYYLTNMMNDPANAGKPRFMISNWGQGQPRHLEPGRVAYAYINWQTLPDTFFIRDANASPIGGFWRKNFAMANPLYPNDARLDSIGFDGLVARMYLDSFFTKISTPYVDLIGENDETQSIYSWNFIKNDAEIRADMAAHSYDTITQFRHYQADRLHTMRLRYREPFRNYIDTLNAAAGRSNMEYYWYELRGGQDTLYPRQKPIVTFNDGRLRAGPYLYPNIPLRWRNGGGAFKGLREMVESLWWQLEDDEKIFIPAVSPGFNDFFYNVEDIDMMRPAQFLSYLKGLSMLGADSYALFMYHANSNVTDPTWRIWKPTMLSYAQAISSRIPEYLYDGNVLLGDVFLSPQGVAPSRYTFNTGNNNDFITGRQLSGQRKFVLSGSVQRRSNDIAAAPRAKNVCIDLSDTLQAVVIPELVFNIRPQGSTYLLDLSGSDTLFYQLDKWHEAKDPWHWCRDFDFEAEVFDSANAVTLHTERPVNTAAGDFSEFTSFTKLPPGNGVLRYHFTPRHDDQDSLYLWVRARGAADSLSASVGGTNVTLTGFSATTFDWIGSTIPISTSLHSEQVAELTVFGDTLEIDRVVFKRSPADFAAQTFSVSISADTLVCFGDTTHFYNASGAPAGCVDYFWDFGDGTFAYDSEPGHVYAYPGVYMVHFEIYHNCLDSSVTDSILVRVDAPTVDAGQDGLHCSGDSLQLQGSTSADLWQWRADTAIADTSLLNSMALPVAGVWYVLSGTDTLTGCSLSDSVRHSTVNFSISYTDSVHLSPGQIATLTVIGGHGYEWTSDPTLSDTAIFNPVANPCDTTVYSFRTWDACNCDTISGQITVFMPSLYQQFLTSDYDSLNCSGDSILVTASGLNPGDSLVWAPGGTIISRNDSDFVAFPYSSTTYFATLVGSGGGCLSGDSISLDVNNCCSTPNVFNFFSPRASSWTFPTVNNVYHIIDTFFIDDDIVFNNCTFLMDSMSVILVQPGYGLTLNGCTLMAACDYMWEGIVLVDSTAQVIITNNSLLRDGAVALRSWYGGEFEVESSTFRDNFIGIRMDNYAGVHPGSIANSRFVSNANTMLEPYDQDLAKCGIWVDDIGSSLIGDSTMNANHFDSLGVGIFGIRSNVRVINNEFRNITGMGAAPLDTTYMAQKSAVYLGGEQTLTPSQFYTLEVGGTAATSNVFEETPYGVEAVYNVRLECSENSFDGVDTVAVTIQDCHVDSCFVEDNTIANSKYGVRAVSNTHGFVRIKDNIIQGDSVHAGMGIRMSGINLHGLWDSGGYDVADNQIDIHGVGIFASAVGGLEVTRNTIDIRSEFSAVSIAAGILVVGTDSANVIENVVKGYMPLTDSSVGIRFEASTRARVKCNQITHFRNCLHFWDLCEESIVKFNEFQDGWRGIVLEDGGNIGQQGDINEPTGNVWIPTSPNSSWVCGIGVADRKMALTISTVMINEDFFVRNTATQNPDIPSDCNSGQGGLGIIFSPTSGTIGSDCAISGGGDDGGGESLEAIASEEMEFPAYPDETQYQAEQMALAMMEADQSLTVGDSLLTACHNELKNGNHGKILCSQQYLIDGAYSLAQTANAFTPQNLLEENHQDVTALAISLGIMGSLSSVELQQLTSIAWQCPLTGGKAVYQARSLLESIQPGLEFDNGSCAPSSNKKGSKTFEALSEFGQDIKLLPNPARDYVLILSQESVEITFYDLSGKVVRHISHPGGEVKVLTSDLPREMVVVRYVFSNGKGGTRKLILQ